MIAFGTLAAAGLPLLLTAAGLVSSMGVLYGITQVTDLSIWTLNFAMMFALALGIDYALFIVTRYRAALHATSRRPAARGRRHHGHRGQGRALLGHHGARSASRRCCSCRSRRSSRWRPG